MNAAALDAEVKEGPHGRRIVRVFADGADNVPSLWTGLYGNAPTAAGSAGYQLSDGEVVTL